MKNSSTHSQQTFKLRDLIKPSFGLWVLAWLLGLATAISVVGLLMTSGWFLTATALAGMASLGSHTFNYMMPAGAIRMMAIARTAGRYGELMVAHNAIFNLLKELRLTFFRRLADEPLTSQHQTLQSGQQMHRLVSDINALNEFNLRVLMPWLFAIVMVALMSSLILLLIGYSHLDFLLVVLLALVFCIILPSVMAYKGISLNKKMARLAEDRRASLIAPMSIITQLLMWKQWHSQTQDFIQYDKHLHAIEKQVDTEKGMTMMVSQWLISGAMLVVLIMVALSVSESTAVIDTGMSFGIPVLMAVLLGLFGIQEVLLPLAQHYMSYGKAVASKERLNELLESSKRYPSQERCRNAGLFDDAESVQKNENPNLNPNRNERVGERSISLKSKINIAHQNADKNLIKNDTLKKTADKRYRQALYPLPDKIAKVTLSNVSAKMPNAVVGAENVSVTINAGVPLIISGASGCGKSTLLQTLANELTLQAGEIVLYGTGKQSDDGIHWHDCDWSDQLGYLGQQLDIFDQTLAENLRLGKSDATENELYDVLDKVALLDWVRSQPQGLNTRLGEYGTAVSGGQARRIALARLLLKPRKVMLLDEPFAGLDKASQSKIWQAVTHHQRQGILIMVSHHDSWDGIGNVDKLHL